MSEINYYLVDVFSKIPFSGNGLTIFPNANKLDKKLMQVLTQEMRQFESIFFYQKENVFRAFIFTMEEELNFAGHPILGLASLIHDIYSKDDLKKEVKIELNKKTINVISVKKDNFYTATMNQGIPDFIGTLNKKDEVNFLSYLNLGKEDKYDNLNLEVITTGLPYLIIPVKSSALSKVKTTIINLADRLSEIGAKFVYILDIDNNRGRTWDNLGLVEDIATGSSAGPVGAYLVKNDFEKFNTQIKITQGEFLNKKSEIRVFVNGDNSTFGDIFVEGDVVKIASGKIDESISY